jgi:hypothetical protein
VSKPAAFDMRKRYPILRATELMAHLGETHDPGDIIGQPAPHQVALHRGPAMPTAPVAGRTRADALRGTRFRFPLHTSTGGALCHREFLTEGDEDPRRQFAETLIESIERFDAPVIVYSSYEQTRLKELA